MTDPAIAETTERVRSRAYEIYRQRAENGGPGDAESDWLSAEREVNSGVPREQVMIETKSKAHGERTGADRDR